MIANPTNTASLDVLAITHVAPRMVPLVGIPHHTVFDNQNQLVKPIEQMNILRDSSYILLFPEYSSWELK